MEDRVVSLEWNLYGHPLTGLLWERQFEKILLKPNWQNIFNWEYLFVHREKRIILVCVCGWHKIGWKGTKYDQMWKVLMKQVDMGEPTSFLDHIYLGCTQRQCETSKGMVDDDRTIFECRIFAVSWEKLPSSENLVLLHGPTIWKVMSGNMWNVIVSM